MTTPRPQGESSAPILEEIGINEWYQTARKRVEFVAKMCKTD